MIDFNLEKGQPTINSDIDLVLQQIDMLFDTTLDEVLDDPEFGSQYDRFLYNLNLSNEAIESQVMSDLSHINLLGFIPRVTVYLLQGTEQDIALIDIILSRDEEQYQKTYRIR